jgi:hypothetical protein
MRSVLVGIALLAAGCSSSKAKVNGGGAGTDGGAAPDAPAGTGGGTDAAGADRAAGAGGAAGATGGAGATAGAGGAAGASTAPTASVLTRNGRDTRDAFYIQPTLTKAAISRMALDANFKATFPGSMSASPLYMENGPGGKGAFFAATTSNRVFALDETTGAVLWMHSIGSAPAQTGAGCGNVLPDGITSTPVIDAATRTIYVAGGVGTMQIDRHEIHALSVDDGSERPGWPVNASALKDPTGLAFNTVAQNQRGALSLVGGVLYVPYGGHAGDCNSYHGWVVAVDTKDPTKTGAWATAGVGAGIWAGGGMASAGNGVFAVTGNCLVGPATQQDCEEVVHLTGLSQLDRTTGVYYPEHWRTMDQLDADFGSSSPLVISVPGSKPSTILAAVAKDGHFYLLDPANLGGMGGHLQDLMIATASMSIRTAPAAYTSTSGLHVVLDTANGASCGFGGRALVSLSITPGSPPTAKQAWCAPAGGDTSPMTTTTDGKNDAIIWILADYLFATDAETGADLGVGTGACLNIHRYTTPIAVKGRIIASADGQLCSWSPH